MGATIQSLDRALARRGFANPDTRRLVRIEILVAAGTSLAALVVTGLSPWGLAYAAGAGLMLFNFWHLARSAKELVQVRKGAVAALVIRFYGRLIVTGLVIAALVAWLEVPVSGLLAGLSTVVVGAVVWGATSFGRKEKEA